MATAYVLTVECRYAFETAHASVHTTRAGLDRFLAAWCRARWRAKGLGPDLEAADDKAATDRYFGHSEETGEDLLPFVAEAEVDPQPPEGRQP